MDEQRHAQGARRALDADSPASVSLTSTQHNLIAAATVTRPPHGCAPSARMLSSNVFDGSANGGKRTTAAILGMLGCSSFMASSDLVGLASDLVGLASDLVGLDSSDVSDAACQSRPSRSFDACAVWVGGATACLDSHSVRWHVQPPCSPLLHVSWASWSSIDRSLARFTRDSASAKRSSPASPARACLSKA